MTTTTPSEDPHSGSQTTCCQRVLRDCLGKVTTKAFFLQRLMITVNMAEDHGSMVEPILQLQIKGHAKYTMGKPNNEDDDRS